MNEKVKLGWSSMTLNILLHKLLTDKVIELVKEPGLTTVIGITSDGTKVQLGVICTNLPKVRKKDEARLLSYLTQNPTPDTW